MSGRSYHGADPGEDPELAKEPAIIEVAKRDSAHVARLRAAGVRIGEGCRIYTQHFSTEPYLVRIGNHVGISGGVKFLTHDGAAHLLRGKRPGAQAFGPIEIGDHVFVGEDAILLPGTRIGAGSIVIAGAVVRGEIAANSLVMGNPAAVVGRASLYLARLARSPNVLDTLYLPEPDRRAVLIRHFYGEQG